MFHVAPMETACSTLLVTSQVRLPVTVTRSRSRFTRPEPVIRFEASTSTIDSSSSLGNVRAFRNQVILVMLGPERNVPARVKSPSFHCGVTKAKAHELSGIPDWRLHDLRRTAGTTMARLGLATHVIGRALNHSSDRRVTGIYDRHGYLPGKRRALGQWSRKLEEIIRPNDNVVPLQG